MYLNSLFLSTLLLLVMPNAKAADTLQIQINKPLLEKGDSLIMEGYVPDYTALKLGTATVNVWIDALKGGKRWKFRYPLIEGGFAASLAIGEDIPDGNYAIHFLVQQGFCKIMGTLLQPTKKDSLLNYLMIPKNKQSSFADNTPVKRDGSFRVKTMLFEDSAYFVFSPFQKVKNNELTIHLETPLDSPFAPVLMNTRFITLNQHAIPQIAGRKEDSASFVFTMEDPLVNASLPGVTVYGKTKKKIEQFDETYSRGLFRNNDAIVFDGIEDETISQSVSLFQFLQGRVPGLTVERDSLGYEVAKWRNEIAEIFVDEFRMEPGDHLFVSPPNIAMIKVYRPPALLSPLSNAGAIAIYTKKGGNSKDNGSHHFIVKGYTPSETIWQ